MKSRLEGSLDDFVFMESLKIILPIKKGEKLVPIKAHKTKMGYVKQHQRKVKVSDKKGDNFINEWKNYSLIAEKVKDNIISDGRDINDIEDYIVYSYIDNFVPNKYKDNKIKKERFSRRVLNEFNLNYLNKKTKKVNNEFKKMDTFLSKFILKHNSKDIINAISDYTMKDSSIINKYLRENKTDNLKINEQIKNISLFLKNAPKIKNVVYRGCHFSLNSENELNNFLNIFKKNNEIQLGGFISTSLNKEKAIEHAGGSKSYSIVFDIKSKNGIFLGKSSLFEDEDEVLFDKNSNFKIIKVDKSEHPMKTYITMEEI